MDVMIPHTGRNQLGLVQDIPSKMLVERVAGARVEARAMQAARVAEMVSIKLADGIVQLRTPVDLQAGQKIQLEWAEQAGKAVLKVVLPTETQRITPLTLQIGQQFPVEIIKLISQGRVFVQTLTAQQAVFDIDISQLSKDFKLGDKLIMVIVGLKPLQIQLQAETPQQRITTRLQQLLNQQQTNSVSLARLTEVLRNGSIPETLKLTITNLLQSSLDKTAVTQSNSLKQAMALSGTFSENIILNQANSRQQDFKVNLAKILVAIETVMAQTPGSESSNKLNTLPAQVLSALAAQGKTVEQLLQVLLSAQNTASPSTIQTLLPGILNKEQAAVLAQLLANSASTNTTIAGRSRPVELAELMLLFKEVAGVHNKLTLNQLLMLRDADSPAGTTASWLFDIPIKNQHDLDLLQMQIKQHKKEGEKENIWSVQLQLDTQNLGAVQATITLVEEDVKVVFRAERKYSAQLLEKHSDILMASLDKSGVTLSHLSCVRGAVRNTLPNGEEERFIPAHNVDISI